MTYRRLEPQSIVATLDKLERRISERFPGAGLAEVCSELSLVARECMARTRAIRQPNLTVRAVVGLVLAACVGLLLYVAGIIEFKRTSEDFLGVVQGIDAFFNVLIVMGAAGLFLFTLEERIKRRRALTDLHELRSIVHVIDMHQLTKDPAMVLAGSRRTKSSPRRQMTGFELMRYLDYCSEMLSLTGKVAVLYAQEFRDPVVISTVTEIEQLSTDLSRKIWQKIMVLGRYEDAMGFGSGAEAGTASAVGTAPTQVASPAPVSALASPPYHTDASPDAAQATRPDDD